MFSWDGRAPTLEAVSLAAWRGQLGADPAEVAKKLNAVPVYKALFTRAFSAPAPATKRGHRAPFVFPARQ